MVEEIQRVRYGEGAQGFQVLSKPETLPKSPRVINPGAFELCLSLSVFMEGSLRRQD